MRTMANAPRPSELELRLAAGRALRAALVLPSLPLPTSCLSPGIFAIRTARQKGAVKNSNSRLTAKALANVVNRDVRTLLVPRRRRP